jgi:hypothetical protein
MDRRFWISGVVAFVFFYLLSFVVHELILGNDYRQMPQLFRPEDAMLSYMPFMVLAQLLMAFAFVWIYRQGITPGAAWLTQGVRFGIAAALFATVPMYLIYYALQPWPGTLVAKQIVLQTISTVIVGIVVAWMNRAALANKS